MNGPDPWLALLGTYLGTGLVVAAWRRATRAPGGLGPWIAVFAFWGWVAAERWLPSSLAVRAAAGVGLMATIGLLVRLGVRQARRGPVGGWAWVLGPVHALGLLVTWIAGERLRKRRAATLPASPRAPMAAGGAGQALESVVELGETTVEEVMIPRSEIEALPKGADVREWARQAQATGRAHLPVYGEDLDEIQGHVRLDDLFGVRDEHAPVTRFLRETRFVPESMRCDDLLRELIAQGERIAIVVDEFGGTAGLVRDRDLLEILLGEIDAEEPPGSDQVEVEPGVFLVDGQVRLDDFNEQLARPLPAGEYETLGGLVLERLGRIPVAGERVTFEQAQIEIVASTERRILQLRVTIPPSPPAARSGGVSGGDR